MDFALGAANIISLVQGEHPQISGGIGVGCGKMAVSTKAVISLKLGKIEQKLLLID